MSDLTSPLQPRLIVRYRQGTSIYVAPNFHERLPEILEVLKAGRELREITRYDDYGRFIHPESTWIRLVEELLREFRDRSGDAPQSRSILLDVFELVAQGSLEHEVRWSKIKAILLEQCGVLSGWSGHPWLASFQDREIVRRDGKYYTTFNGQECEITGCKTEQEERCDFIINSCLQSYGRLQNLFRAIALANVCRDYQVDPHSYPESAAIILHDNNGGTGYLHWAWHLRVPYVARPIPWRPRNVHCDPQWLAADFIAAFCEKEAIPDRETLPPEWKGPKGEWERRFIGYPGQLEFAIDTTINFGNEEEVWFEFEGLPVRWVNQTDFTSTLVIIPVKDRNDDLGEYKVVLKFLSRMAYETRAPLRIISTVGAASRFAPILHQPRKRLGVTVYPDIRYFNLHSTGNPKLDLAYALYREGVNSHSVYYAFLSFYKIIQLALDEDGARITEWINANLNHASIRSQRVEAIRSEHGDVVPYLFSSGRCAIAHVSKDPVANPDDPQDETRLRQDLDLVRGLAHLVIESGILNTPAFQSKGGSP